MAHEVEVWDALVQRMPLTALVRNLGKMAAVGLVKPFSQAAELVVRKLKDEALLKRARIYPLAVLTQMEKKGFRRLVVGGRTR